MYAADGSVEWAEFWRQMELARVAYRSGRTMNFFVDRASAVRRMQLRRHLKKMEEEFGKSKVES